LESLQASVAKAPGVDTMTPGIQMDSLSHQRQKRCCDCGSAMQRLVGVFWFFEAEDFDWKISLPFCPICEPQLTKDCSETVH
jgi:hypothetical protein